jgi:beta-galactosidase
MYMARLLNGSMRLAGMFALLLMSAAVAFPQATEKVSLSGVWDFAFAADAAAADRLSGFYAAGFQGGSFKPVPVPSNWPLLGYEEPVYSRPLSQAEGFYLRRFQAPANLRGKRVLLRFGGVWASAEVWLNSAYLGRHDSGFTEFAYDVTRSIKPGEENLLAVRVRQATKDSMLDVNDDWSLPGIYRDVWLQIMPAAAYIDRVETDTVFDDQFRDADLNLRVSVAGSQLGPYQLRTTLTAPDGKQVQQTSLDIPRHQGTARDTFIRIHTAAPLQWTAETPNLYRLTVELVQEGTVTHLQTLAVGFRQISTAGGVLRVNGQSVKLRGVNRHDENPDVGRATTREQWIEDLQLMKAANINTVRTSHYPPAEGFIALCDEIGMYVIDEVPMGFGGESGDDPSFVGAGLLRAQETIARDRNHPSVIVWSIGNEDPLTSMHMAVIRLVKGSDPTRPLLMPWRADYFMPPEIDILAPHYRTPSNLDQLAAHSGRPIISTEYTHAYAEEGFGGLEESWRALTSHPSGAGAAIWMWQDQGLIRTRTGAGGQPEKYMRIVTDGWDGIVTADRKPQRDYWETKAVYAPISVPALPLEFRPGQSTIRVPISNEYDFTDLSTVEIRWSVMADDRQLAQGEARISAAPHAAGYLTLPLDAIKKVEAGTTYYSHLVFLRADGSEITRRAVELLPAGPRQEKASAAGQQVRVHFGKTVSVTAGSSVYEFNPATALLASASIGGSKVVAGSRFVAWRPLGPNDTIVMRAGQANSMPDLNVYATTVKSWKVSSTNSGVRIEAEAEHKAGDHDSLGVSYVYEIGRDGVLTVSYSVRPRVTAPWLPEIGVQFDAADGLEDLRWLGLGPLDAYPNERTAPILGVYSGRAGSGAVKGNKAIRWAELRSNQGAGLRVEGSGYVRLEGKSLRVLPSVVGRSEKGRRPEAPEYRLDTGGSAEFHGRFSLELMPGSAK